MEPAYNNLSYFGYKKINPQKENILMLCHLKNVLKNLISWKRLYPQWSLSAPEHSYLAWRSGHLQGGELDLADPWRWNWIFQVPTRWTQWWCQWELLTDVLWEWQLDRHALYKCLQLSSLWKACGKTSTHSAIKSRYIPTSPEECIILNIFTN